MAFMPVIISGGAGSRLWPLSRDACPKPFVEMPDGSTLIGRTYARAVRLDGVERIVTVTNRDFLFLTSDAYQAAGARAVTNTGPAPQNWSGRRVIFRAHFPMEGDVSCRRSDLPRSRSVLP